LEHPKLQISLRKVSYRKKRQLRLHNLKERRDGQVSLRKA
jgi:hypothetical protein